MSNNKVIRCPDCGFRIRGKNHEEGPHHKRDKEYVTSDAAMKRALVNSMKGVPTNVGNPRHHDNSCGCYQHRRT